MQKLTRLSLFLLVLSISVAFSPLGRPKRPTELGERIVSALAQRDFNLLSSLQPGIIEWRVLVPDQTEGLSDEEITAKMEAGNSARLRGAFEELIQAGREKKIKFRNLTFNQVTVQRFYEDPKAPVGLEVMFFYDHYHGKIKTTVVEQEGEWFLLEIKDPSNSFVDVRQQ
ncbi:MAG: hypothetical protein H6581_00075 [Bacteroidia bacterium]|nr:hypothetical protein [Bacteroidia bacterium]